MAEEYPSNSNRSKNDTPAVPEKKVQTVVSGGAKTRKKSEAKKLADTFISEDAGNVKNYILGDVLIPAIKKAVCDIVTNGIEMILYGETGRSKGSTVNYSKISTRRYDRPGERRDYTASARRGFDYEEVIVPSRGAAQKILDCMDKKSSLLAFMLGMAVGSAVTWQMIKDRYERRIEEDRKSLEEMYAAKLEEASAKVQPVEEEPEAETPPDPKEIAEHAREKPEIAEYG